VCIFLSSFLSSFRDARYGAAVGSCNRCYASQADAGAAAAAAAVGSQRRSRLNQAAKVKIRHEGRFLRRMCLVQSGA
jgi:hypothetical protein